MTIEVGTVILTLGLTGCSPLYFLASTGPACSAWGSCWVLRYGLCLNPRTGCLFPTGPLPACTGPWQHENPQQSSDPFCHSERNIQYVNKQQVKRKCIYTKPDVPTLSHEMTWSYLYGPLKKLLSQFLQRDIGFIINITQLSQQAAERCIPNHLCRDGEVKHPEVIK